MLTLWEHILWNILENSVAIGMNFSLKVGNKDIFESISFVWLAGV